MIDWLTQIALEMDVIFFIVLIFSEKGTPSKIIMWGLVFIILPLVGFILYIILGQSFYSERKFSLKGIRDENVEQAKKESMEDLKSESNEDYRTTMQAVGKLGGVGYSTNNDVKLYVLGEDKFKDFYADLRAAKKYIHVEYYIIRNDELGNELLDILTEKVKEGVEVKLLTDFFGVLTGPKKSINKFKAAGGEFASFHNVLWLLFSPKKNNRNHRKIAVIDGVIGYCGGFNVGDEYLGKGPMGFWRDTAVRMSGGAVLPTQLRFQMDWEYATKEPLCDASNYEKYYCNTDYPTTGDARVMMVSGGPDCCDFNPVRMQYLTMINKAKKSIYIHSPYFIPDESVMDALSMAVGRGVDVRVIIPDKPDHMFVFWNNMRSAYFVMGNGVKVYNYNRGFVHSKTVVVDGEYCSVGSANMDDRSLVLNFETNAFIISKEIGEQMDKAFMEDLEYSTESSRDVYENLTGYQLLRMVVSRMFQGLE